MAHQQEKTDARNGGTLTETLYFFSITGTSFYISTDVKPPVHYYFFFHLLSITDAISVRMTASVIGNHVYGTGRSTVFMP